MRRRIELDPRYANRQVFAAERGINYRIVSSFERGERSNYDASTIAAIEVGYGLRPGAIAGALDGGDLGPVASPEPEARPPVPPEPPTSAEAARRLFPGDETLQLLWQLDESEDHRARLIEVIRELRRKSAGEGDGRAAG